MTATKDVMNKAEELAREHLKKVYGIEATNIKATMSYQDFIAGYKAHAKETDEFIDKLKELKKIHHDSTKPMDGYFTGMYNGIECVLCLLEEREPSYKSVEKAALSTQTDKVHILIEELKAADEQCKGMAMENIDLSMKCKKYEEATKEINRALMDCEWLKKEALE